MGTSLSGLTPATTFDGLLKTSDNDAITSSLKTIGSGDGTDSCLQLSNSALKVNSAQVTIVGAGNTSATTSLLVQNSAGTESLTFSDDGLLATTGNIEFDGYIGTSNGTYSITPGATTNFQIKSWAKPWHFFKQIGTVMTLDNDGNLGLGNSTDTNTARLHVKGSGNTSGTTSLLVQNSDANDMFKITDDGGSILTSLGASNTLILDTTSGTAGFEMQSSNGQQRFRIQASSTSTRFTPNNTGGFTFIGNSIFTSGAFDTADARLHVKGAGNTDATTSLLVQNSDGTDALEVLDGGTQKQVKMTSSQIGSLSFFSSTIEVGTGVKTKIVSNGLAVNRDYTTADAMLHVKGSGATSATTSLLVENSSGDEHLKITDDGIINARQSIIVNHATNSSRSLRLSWGSLYATDNASELNIGAVYSQPTAPKIVLGGKTRSSGADAVLVQALNGMYLSTTASTENPSAQLHVKGSGATNATTTLLVENSSGTDLMSVTDDGKIKLGTSSSIVELISGYNNRFQQNRLSFYSTNTNIRGINAGGQGLIVSKSTGTSDLYPTAILAIDSTTQGFLPPRMTGEQIDAIESPASGLIIYNTTSNKAVCYNGTSWNDMF